jgi:hypothetical protein
MNPTAPPVPFDIGQLADLALRLGTPGAVELVRTIEAAGAQLARGIAADLGVSSGACRLADGAFVALLHESFEGQAMPAKLAELAPSAPWRIAPARRETPPPLPNTGRTFYRSVYEIEVLSDGIPGEALVDGLQRHLDGDGMSAEARFVGSERLTGGELAVHLREISASPSAFGLDSYGNELPAVLPVP